MPVGDFEFTPGQNSNHHSRDSSNAQNRNQIHFNGTSHQTSNGNSYYGSQYSPSYADLNSPSRRNDSTTLENSTFVFSNENRSVKNIKTGFHIRTSSQYRHPIC